MKDIILIGAFHEMVELCEDSGLRIAGIIDNECKGDYYGYPVIGTDADAAQIHLEYPECCAVLTPDPPGTRRKLVGIYRAAGFSFINVIHPGATVSRYARIGEGTIIQNGVNVSANCTIGSFCKLNTRCNVMHDNVIGDFTTIAPNAVLLGYVSVGSMSYIGANSTVLPNCHIGNDVMIGAGAVVTKDVVDTLVMAGVPARIIVKQD